MKNLNLLKIIRNFFVLPLFLVIVSLLLLGAVKGQKSEAGDIDFQYSYSSRPGTPFESTNSTSRYALTQAIVDNGRFYFDEAQAKFSSPDTSFYNGKYFSLFTPGISFLAAPFYFAGKLIGLPQLTTFLTNIIFALINVYLIYRITRKLGVNLYVCLIAGLVFLFGSNALAYSLSLTQHHVAAAILLVSILLALEKVSVLNNILFGALFGFGLMVDIPVGFLMMPLGFYFLYKNFETTTIGQIITVKLKYAVIALLIGLIPLLGIFGWYNYQLTGSYTQLAQLIGRADVPDTNPNIIKKEEPKVDAPGPKEFKIAETPFNTRNELDGFIVLLFGEERGWLYFSPVMALSIIGMYFAIKQRETRTLGLLLSTVGASNVLLYSMFGDPYGGWSFGPRYLIPATAAMAPGVGFFIQKWGKNILAALVFFVTAGFSIWLSTVGAMTTSAIPPKQESIYLLNPIPYTYQYNLDFIDQNFSSSLFYNFVLSNVMNVSQFVTLYSSIIIGFAGILYLTFILNESNRTIALPHLQIKLPGIKRLSLPAFSFTKKTSIETVPEITPSLKKIKVVKRKRRNK